MFVTDVPRSPATRRLQCFSSRPPVRPAGNTVLPEYIVIIPQKDDTDLPHQHRKAPPPPAPGHCRRRVSTLHCESFFSRLLNCLVQRRYTNVSTPVLTTTCTPTTRQLVFAVTNRFHRVLVNRHHHHCAPASDYDDGLKHTVRARAAAES